MKASLRRLTSPDVSNLESYAPPQSEVFGFLLQVFAGPEDGSGEETFSLTVCTPRWLEQQYEESAVVSGCHHLIVFRYDYARLLQVIASHLDSVEGESWLEVATKLSLFGKWEFQDYAG